MISRDKFDYIKEKYGYYSSWAVWAEEGDKPKSNIGDLAILDPDLNPKLLQTLTTDFILVALNISRGDIKEPLGNFHDRRPEATDYKIRYALRDTPFWGSYMTDIIKDFDQKISGKVATYLRQNKPFEEDNVLFFRNELKEIGSEDPTLIAFGNISFGILNRYFKNEYKILKIPHYANYTSKETYREQVQYLND